MLNLINLLDYSSGEALCSDLAPVLKIVGILYWGIMVAVPIILIIIGMMDMAKAVAEKSEDDIKKAQNKLVKRAIAAVIVFLIGVIVSVIMNLVGHNEYKTCMECITGPFGKECKALVKDAND